jgi:hypothetical protein
MLNNNLQQTLLRNQKLKKEKERKLKEKQNSSNNKLKMETTNIHDTISQTEFRNLGLVKTVEFLKGTNSVKYIHLKHCNLENNLPQFIEALKNLKKLKQLDLSCKNNFKY